MRPDDIYEPLDFRAVKIHAGGAKLIRRIRRD